MQTRTANSCASCADAFRDNQASYPDKLRRLFCQFPIRNVGATYKLFLRLCLIFSFFPDSTELQVSPYRCQTLHQIPVSAYNSQPCITILLIWDERCMNGFRTAAERIPDGFRKLRNIFKKSISSNPGKFVC